MAKDSICLSVLRCIFTYQPGSLQFCIGLHFLFLQSLNVNRRWDLRAFSGLSWACAQFWVCVCVCVSAWLLIRYFYLLQAYSDFLFPFESVSIICVFLGMHPFHLGYTICWYAIIYVILILLCTSVTSIVISHVSLLILAIWVFCPLFLASLAKGLSILLNFKN